MDNHLKVAEAEFFNFYRTALTVLYKYVFLNAFIISKKVFNKISLHCFNFVKQFVVYMER